MSEIVFQRLPRYAESDVGAALDRVLPSTQVMLIQAAEDAGVPDRIAVHRLAAIWAASVAVNVADDLADGDCNYLESRVGPGISFLFQSLAVALAVRGEVTPAGLGEHAIGLVRAAAGQSVEVRRGIDSARQYIQVAELIAGDQYAAYFRLLWDGTAWDQRARAIGRTIGTVGLLATDLASGDCRFGGMPSSERADVLEHCRRLIQELGQWGLPSLEMFIRYATAALD